MTEKSDILSEILMLIEQQLHALKEPLPGDGAIRYAQRTNQIEELLSRLSADNIETLPTSNQGRETVDI
jgi:hypothetical protein